MQIDLIKEIASEIVGKNAKEAIDILYKKKNVNEFLISKKLNLTINQTRNLLYRLADRGLVYFIRKKDSKKGGWYTYFWTLNEKRALELLKEQKNSKLKELEAELEKRKKERYYYCPVSWLEYKEEEALEHNFICPETGEVLQLKDNKEEVNKLDIEISKIKLFMNNLDTELEELEKKEKKERERKFKVDIKKKEAERKAKREKMKKERAKEEKKKMKKEKKKSKPKNKKTARRT